jgi:hypothetical protein
MHARPASLRALSASQVMPGSMVCASCTANHTALALVRGVHQSGTALACFPPRPSCNTRWTVAGWLRNTPVPGLMRRLQADWQIGRLADVQHGGPLSPNEGGSAAWLINCRSSLSAAGRGPFHMQLHDCITAFPVGISPSPTAALWPKMATDVPHAAAMGRL